MKKISLYLMLLVLPLLFSDCAATKYNGWLNAHRENISRVANDASLSGEQKMDILLTSYVSLMDEGLRFTNPVKGVKYIKKFQSQNQASIEKILSESNTWANNLNDFQTASLALRTTQKPYIRQLIDLVPKFNRKYEQYKFVAEMTSNLAKGFGNIGNKILKFGN